MQEAFNFPGCPFCKASVLRIAHEGGGGATAICKACGRGSYFVTQSATRQEWPDGVSRHPEYDGPLDVVKAHSTWLCDNAWSSEGPIVPPEGCRVVIGRNDMRLCEARNHDVISNICIPCSLQLVPPFWTRMVRAGSG